LCFSLTLSLFLLFVSLPLSRYIYTHININIHINAKSLVLLQTNLLLLLLFIFIRVYNKIILFFNLICSLYLCSSIKLHVKHVGHEAQKENKCRSSRRQWKLSCHALLLLIESTYLALTKYDCSMKWIRGWCYKHFWTPS